MTLVIEDLPFTNPSNTFFKHVSANHGIFTTLLLAGAVSRFTNRMFGKMGRASLEHGVCLAALPPQAPAATVEKCPLNNEAMACANAANITIRAQSA